MKPNGPRALDAKAVRCELAGYIFGYTINHHVDASR